MSAISHTSPQDWTYIAEGGSTIVFSYSGPRNLNFDGTVIRLRKSPVASQLSTQIVEESDDPTVGFQEYVLQRVVASKFLPRLEHVQVQRDWLERIVTAHESVRPLKRRQTTQIDLTRTKAVLATNLIGNHGWAIEIKPKWGFLPEPAHLSERTRPLKTHICRFCMQKNIAKNDGFRPSYCPLDLYSNSEDRMCTALHALWDGWVESHGAANNLRIFVSGQVLDPSGASCASTLSRGMGLDEVTLFELREKFTSIVLAILVEHPALLTLSRIQRSLDPLDIEGLSRLCTASPNDDYPHSPLPLPTGPLTADPDLKEWSSFLDFASKNLLLDKSQSLDHARPDKSNQRFYLLAYLLSTTFKDCSIIIRPNGDDAKSATVTFIDLDAKSFDKLERWEALDRQVLRASTTDDRVCVDNHKNQ